MTHPAAAKNKPFRWKFRRLGGLDQATFETGEDLRRLRELDPKLWVALSCPASGLEFDQRTLTLVDRDKDNRIRIPEIIEAVEWACGLLKDPGELREERQTMPLAAIDDDNPEGARLLATAKAILASLGKPGATDLTQEDVTQAAAHASEQVFNGDGILPAIDAFGPEVRDFIRDALAVSGGMEDAGGEIGVNRAIAAAFAATLRAWLDWRQSVNAASSPLAENTPEAWSLLCDLKDKMDDYFLRCELAAYSPASLEALNNENRGVAAGENGLLNGAVLAAMPLSRIGPDRPLDLHEGINPAWRDKLERLGGLAGPFLAKPGTMTRAEWLTLQTGFEEYARALSGKPEPVAAAVSVPPTLTVDKLGEDRIREILAGDSLERFNRLAEQDANVPGAAADIAKVERLVLYYRHLHRLLENFVSFGEFYAPDRKAAFQSGSLFIDGRICRLCMPADSVETHSVLAANSQLYLLYCECTRGRKAGEADGKKINIVAAVTAGNADLLVQNRNGVYVDNTGQDWDATVVKIVSNPIGLWQAVWSPYKKFGNMITEQLSKFASDRQKVLMDTASKKIGEISAVSAPGTPPPKFDVTRNIGMFAAVGLALGALGTAAGSIATALFSMEWWQFPLLFFGIFAVISGPSVLMAYLKLRQRTLGPLLEASGWAVNARVPLNRVLSRRLTSVAALPKGAIRVAGDPLSGARHLRGRVFLVCFLIGCLAMAGWLYLRRRHHPVRGIPSTPAITVFEQKSASGGAPASVAGDAAGKK